jgi:hypothetical protein
MPAEAARPLATPGLLAFRADVLVAALYHFTNLNVLENERYKYFKDAYLLNVDSQLQESWLTA